MKPLSVWKYYLNNKKRFFSVFACIFLTVFLLYVMHMMLSSMTYAIYGSWIRPFDEVSLMTPVANDKLLEDKVINDIKANKNIEKTLPVARLRTNISNTFGGSNDTNVYAMKEQDIKYLMDKMNLKLTEGRLPSQNADEIVLHYRVALNKDLKVGDKIGSFVDKDERLVGQYTIVGLIDGPAIVSFLPLDKLMSDKNLTQDMPGKTGMILVPKAKVLKELNNDLEKIPADEARIDSYKTEKKDVDDFMSDINNIMTTIELVLCIVLVLTISMVTYIFLYQRRNEYSLLQVIGFTRGQIVRKAMLEVSVINLIGYLGGIIFAIITGFILNALVYNEMGQPLVVLSTNFILRTFIIPFLIITTSIIPVSRMLKKLDSISIIEGQV